MLSATNSLTNLSNESHYALQRCNSAEEVFETNSINRMHAKARQKAKDRHFVADSTSDYYTSRRPQSMFLNSQAPVYSSLQPASSVSALCTISENETWDHTLTRPHTHSWAPEERASYPERSITPLFRYTPTPVMEMAPLSRPTTPQVLGQQRAMTPQILGEGVFLDDCSGRATPISVPIHSSEQVTREFVPLFLNPHNGKVYSRDDGFFMPITNQDELLAKPPTPDKRTEDQTQPTYKYLSKSLALLFLVCGNVFALAICSLPALFCSKKVNEMNKKKRYVEAKKYSKYVLRFNILGIVFHMILIMLLMIIAAAFVVIIFVI